MRIFLTITSLFSRNKILIGSILFLAIYSSALIAFATPPASPFTAGETNDPSCGPTDSNCYVAGAGAITVDTTYDNIFSNTDNAGASLDGLNGGNNNLFLGRDAGALNTIGYNNVFIASYAGANNDIGSDNLFIGSEAGNQNTTGNLNLFLGSDAGYSNDTGSGNIFEGGFAGNSNTSGGTNIFIGVQAGFSNDDGSSNTFIGYKAGRANVSGVRNIGIGSPGNAVNQGSLSGVTTGNANTALGNQTGITLETGVGNLILGYNANVTAADTDYATAVGMGAVSDADGIALGHAAIAASYEFALPDTITNWKFQGVSYELPTSDSAGVLTSDGSGVLTWAAGGGSVDIGSDLASSTSGSILFADASNNLAQDNDNLFWNNTQKFLGIGTTSPSSEIDVSSPYYLKEILPATEALGSDPITSGGSYTGTEDCTYSIDIDGDGSNGHADPNTFTWYTNCNADGDTGVEITGGAQTLSNGVTVTFPGTSGYDIGSNAWNIPTYASLTAAINVARGGSFKVGTNFFATEDPRSNIKIGYGARYSALGYSNTIIGFGGGSITGPTGTSNILISAQGGSTGRENVAIGYSANVSSFNYSIALGSRAEVTADNQFVVGNNFQDGNDSDIKDMYLGGVYGFEVSTVTVHAPGGKIDQDPDKDGYNLALAGGIASGSAVGGSILFKTSDADVSSMTPQALSTKLTIAANGTITMASRDMGDGVAGPVLIVGRNTNGTNTGAGSIDFLDKTGTAGYVWQDAAGKMRINTAAPSNANDTSGTIIGTQSSTRETKQDITDYTDYEHALQLILDAPLHHFRYKKEVAGYGSDSPLAKTYIGYIADEVDPQFMNGNSIDQVSVNGLLIAAVKELNIKLTDIANLTEADNSFVGRIRSWLADVGNGITSIFSKEVVTEKICVKDENGQTCLTRSQVDALISGGTSGGNSSTTSGTTGTTGDQQEETTSGTTGEESTSTTGDTNTETTGDTTTAGETSTTDTGLTTGTDTGGTSGDTTGGETGGMTGE